MSFCWELDTRLSAKDFPRTKHMLLYCVGSMFLQCVSKHNSRGNVQEKSPQCLKMNKAYLVRRSQLWQCKPPAATFLVFAVLFKLVHPAYGDDTSATLPPGNRHQSPAYDAVLAGTDVPTVAAVSGTSFAREGDFYMGGLFDIHSEQDGVCNEINPMGLQWMYAMVFAIEIINERNDLLPNITLGFHMKDSCGNPNVAVTSSLDFITSSSSLGTCENNSTQGDAEDSLGTLVAVVGPATSNAAVAVASLFQLFKLPEISYSATSELLSESRYSYFTRVVPGDEHQATALADVVSHFGWSVVATLAMDDMAYGQNGLDLFLKRAKNKGICVAYKNKIGSSSTEQELHAIVKDLRTFPNIKVIVAFSDESPMIRLLEVFADQNATGYTWIGTDAWTTSPALTADEGIAKVTRGMLGLRYTTREVNGFVEYLRSLSPMAAGYQDTFLTEYWEQTFMCYTSVGQDGSHVYNTKCSGNEVLPESDKLFAGNFVSTILDSVEVVAKALHSALGCGEMHCDGNFKDIDGREILALMKNVSFIGKSGYKIELTEGGNLGSGAIYDVFNLKPATLCSSETIVEKIGLWNNKEGFIIHGNITWQSKDSCSLGAIPISICSAHCLPGQHRISKLISECCWECVDCHDNRYSNQENALTCSNCSSEEIVNTDRTGCIKLPDLFLMPGSYLGVVILTLSITGIIITVAFGVIFIHRRHTQVVVRACAGHCYAILFCAVLCFVFSWLPLFPASDVYCGVKAFLQLLPVALLQGMLVLTAYVTKKGRKFVTIRTRIFIVMGVLVIFCVFSGIWFAVDVPKSSRIPDAVAKIIYVDCQDGELFVIGLSFSYSLILDAIGLSLSFRRRNQEENFTEGKFIFYSFTVHIMVWVTTVGIYFATESGKHFQVFILVIGITFTGYVPLLLLYIPKLYLMKTKPYASEKIDARTKRKIKGKSHVRGRCRKTRAKPEVIMARRALLSNCIKALNAIRGEKAQSIRTATICMERIEELRARHRKRLDTKKSLLRNILKRKIYLVVSSRYLQSTQV